MGLICNFDTQETDEGLKELAQIDYDDREYKSRVSDSTWDDSTEEDDGLLERNGNPRREEFQFPFISPFCMIPLLLLLLIPMDYFPSLRFW